MSALDLALQPVKQRGLDFQHAAAPTAGGVHVIPFGACLIVMAMAVDVHQVEPANDAEPLQRPDGTIDRDQMQTRHLLPGAL